MHYAISATWGPTAPDPRHVAFIFAALSGAAGDTVTMMLFTTLCWSRSRAPPKLVPVGPPNRYEGGREHPNVTLWACKPCVDARGLPASRPRQAVKLAA